MNQLYLLILRDLFIAQAGKKEIDIWVDGYFNYFQFCAVANKTAINIFVQIFLWTFIFISHVLSMNWMEYMIF